MLQNMLAYWNKVIKAAEHFKTALPIGKDSAFNIHLLQMEPDDGEKCCTQWIILYKVWEA